MKLLSQKLTILASGQLHRLPALPGISFTVMSIKDDLTNECFKIAASMIDVTSRGLGK